MIRPQDSRINYAVEWAKRQRQYKADPQSFLDERTWTCPYCDRRVEPMVLNDPMQKGEDEVAIIRRESCGCDGEHEAKRLQEEETERTKRNSVEWGLTLNGAGLTDWLATATFSSYTANTSEEKHRKQEALAYCQALMADTLGHKSWLVMHGQWGSGKTHIAAAIVQNVLAKGRVGRFRVWSQWLEDLMSTFGGQGDSGGLVRELRGGYLVAIDDIDKQHPTKSGWAEEKLFNVLNYRYNLGLATVLTFNHQPREMEPWLGTALVDRMIERSRVIEFTGPSYRSGVEWGRKD